jgi:hypothetical protein
MAVRFMTVDKDLLTYWKRTAPLELEGVGGTLDQKARRTD